MNGPQAAAQFIISIFKFHKLKVLSFFASIILFFLLLFPYNDLADLVSIQVAKLTNNQVYLQFEDLGFNIIPAPGILMDDVTIDATLLPASLNLKSLSVFPAVAKLLQFKKGISLEANGLLDGDLFLTVADGKKLENNLYLQDISLNLEAVDLKKLKELVSLPVSPKGAADLTAEFGVDPSFVTQPDGEFQLDLKSVKIPATSANTPLGELPLPALSFSQGILKGRIVKSELIIEQLQLGTSKDPIYVNAKGKVGMIIQKRGLTIKPNFNSYAFRVDLNVSKNTGGSLGLFLSFIDQFKQPGPKYNRYLFQASGLRFGTPPKLSPIRQI